MKKKLILSTFIFFAIICMQFIFTNDVEAATCYNDEIYYNEIGNNKIEVIAAGTFIEKATIPPSINGKPVTRIGSFKNCTSLRSVTIPSSVTEISINAFSGCTALTSISIPSSVTKIPSGGFKDCTSLKSISLPESITEIGMDAFYGCQALSSITIPSKVSVLSDSVFLGCGLTSITIGPNIKTICNGAFKNCTKLTSVYIPATVTDFGSSSNTGIFEGCTSLKTANIQATDKTLDGYMFVGCTALTSVTLSNSCVNCEGNVFEDCTSLQSVVLPYQLKKIGNNMFYNCKKLSTVNLPDTVEEIGYAAFYNCTSLNSIWVPARKILGGYYSGAFSGCTNLKNVYCTKKVQEIDGYAFENVPASTLTIYGYSGTCAQSYASGKGYKYVSCIPVSSIGVSGSKNVAIGNNIKLNATVNPTNAFKRDVRWVSSNSNIATVDYYTGTITGKNTGTVTITAQAIDGTGVKATYNVTVTPSDLPFMDVKTSDWYYNAVKYTYTNNIISGYSANQFAPNDNLTRGMIVTILYRMEGSPSVGGNSKFSDVNSSEWYAKAVKWAADKGIVHGYSGTTKFGPNDNIIRQDLAGILRNYAGYKKKNINVTSQLTKFSDYRNIDSYANASMQWAVGVGVITGNSNGTLNPKGTATRAEAAAMIQKYCNKVGR